MDRRDLHTLRSLRGGYARTDVLQQSLLGISKKMLTQTLRDMQASGLIERNVVSTVPSAVEYWLSPLGVRSVEPVRRLYDWGIGSVDAFDALTPRAGSRRVFRPTSQKS